MDDTAHEQQAQTGAQSSTTNDTPPTDATNPPLSELQDGSNKFQQAIAAWRTLDLSTLISSLDTTASDLVEHQKDSLVQRKELAQKTKDFRKLEDEKKLVEIKDLLKSYQGYVDLLTNHAKGAQAAFMQVYSPLSEAPDPYPLLEASIESLVTAEEVVPRLEGENQGLRKQNAKLNAQLEESEKSLEQERTKRVEVEQEQDRKIREVEGSWDRVLKEKEENWTAKEKALEEKAEGQERLLKELKANYEVSQRLERSGGEETQDMSRGSATQAELDIVNSELEKANTRLADLESRNEQLRVELAQSAGQANSSAKSTAVEDDPAYMRLRSENQSLLRKLDTARYDKDSEKSSIESKLRGLEREISSLKADRDALQARVQKWNDYDEVKRERDMLRTIEFSTTDDTEAGDEELQKQINGSADSTTKNGESLEQLLLSRNKKLSNDLTELRVSQNELHQRFEQLQEDLSTANMDLEKSQKLNATLENDLQKAQQHASNAFENMSVAGTWTSRHPAKSAYGSTRRGGGTSPTSSIIGGFDPNNTGAGSPRLGSGGLESLRAGAGGGGGGGGAGPDGGNQGILPMVTAQRDRFKKKISELEAELQKQYTLVSSLRSEIASLQRDNLNLYEKTRYVSTYNRASGGASSYAANPNPSTIPIGSSSSSSFDTTGPAASASDRYRTAYEANLSPFAAFRGRETQRALKRMNLLERAVFQVTRMVLATRASRNLFAGYCVALHVLVFVMLYWMGMGDLESRGSVGAATAAGVAAAGVGGGGVGDAGFGGSGGVGSAGNVGSGGDWRPEGFQAAGGGG
ncbi:hypothetical protein KC343_g10652 [Hortaea werneckii]|uniref:Protein CASP n=1 Tax=Hortaea werneckii TaxID=91943 RepID=A0A3M7EXW3_HORWE|nr:hypothetical protein KC320_g756 [Hortaea werneckii]KAI7614042.1 hypothetical protein KC343_g10652 [Hortaea werneckii]KAI7657023.1 hypothetical protein KC319_g9612 [Hortaea werneckii]KAI7693833.1 hypothetical protein KC322_g10602 [Hortaea werneckii]RMY80994.1 hypothetical protein D0864_08450 [Hortaea werneckii]